MKAIGMIFMFLVNCVLGFYKMIWFVIKVSAIITAFLFVYWYCFVR